jgi:hypothetical protein
MLPRSWADIITIAAGSTKGGRGFRDLLFFDKIVTKKANRQHIAGSAYLPTTSITL